MSHKIFVYGTLKRGGYNHHLLADPSNGEAVYIGTGTLTKPYPIVEKWDVPCLLPEMPHNKTPNIVQGELYEINDSMLAVLDELEDHPQTYLRTPTQCVLHNTSKTSNGFQVGIPVDCEVYFFNEISDHPYLYDLPYVSSYKVVPKKRKTSLQEAMSADI